MILIDSSVWVDYFRGTVSLQTDRLDSLLSDEPLAIGDLILAEVLQGFTDEAQFELARRMFASLILVELGGQSIAVQAARNFRFLRARGITIRKTVDCMIATWCIENGCALLHHDRDFDPFMKHLRLRSVC